MQASWTRRNEFGKGLRKETTFIDSEIYILGYLRTFTTTKHFGKMNIHECNVLCVLFKVTCIHWHKNILGQANYATIDIFFVLFVTYIHSRKKACRVNTMCNFEILLWTFFGCNTVLYYHGVDVLCFRILIWWISAACSLNLPPCFWPLRTTASIRYAWKLCPWFEALSL